MLERFRRWLRRTPRAFAGKLLDALNRYVLDPMDNFFETNCERLERFRRDHVLKTASALLSESADDEDTPPAIGSEPLLEARAHED